MARMDVSERIEEIIELVEAARSMPMSGSCVVNRAELIGLLDDLLADLPSEFRHVRALLDERDGVLLVAREKAEHTITSAEEESSRIVAAGESERDRLVSESQVLADAEREAAALVAGAEADVDRMRDEVDDYLGRTLDQFEQLLNRSLQTVERGRERLRAREAVDPER